MKKAIEDASREYLDKIYAEKGHQGANGNPHIPYYCVQDAFIDGAKWMAKQLERKE